MKRPLSRFSGGLGSYRELSARRLTAKAPTPIDVARLVNPTIYRTTSPSVTGLAAMTALTIATLRRSTASSS